MTNWRPHLRVIYAKASNYQRAFYLFRVDIEIIRALLFIKLS